MINRIPYDACPLCAAPALGAVVEKEVDCCRHALYHSEINPLMRWLRCGGCGHVFTEGYWDPEALALIFAKTHDNQKPCYDFEGQRNVSAEIVEKVVRSLDQVMPRIILKQEPQPPIWLDVGFGNGSLLFTAAEFGFHPVGLDLRTDSVEAMAALGVSAHCSDITDYERDLKVQVISMADCLEHMPFAKKGLEAARRLICRAGALFLSMPNMSAPLWQYLDAQNKNPFWGEIEHYHNFSRERLYALLRETGFEPASYGISKRYRVCMEVIAHAV